MSEAKHTPGPWTIIPAVEYDGDDEDFQGAYTDPASIEGSDGNPVCMFGNPAGSACLFENEADYHLIAAAPEMLEALKYARRFLRKEDHDTGYIDAAIAKAEGRS